MRAVERWVGEVGAPQGRWRVVRESQVQLPKCDTRFERWLCHIAAGWLGASGGHRPEHYLGGQLVALV